MPKPEVRVVLLKRCSWMPKRMRTWAVDPAAPPMACSLLIKLIITVLPRFCCDITLDANPPLRIMHPEHFSFPLLLFMEIILNLRQDSGIKREKKRRKEGRKEGKKKKERKKKKGREREREGEKEAKSNSRVPAYPGFIWLYCSRKTDCVRAGLCLI